MKDVKRSSNIIKAVHDRPWAILPSMLAVIEEIVQLRSDIELRIAEDGREALGIAAAWPPDVLVLDAHLPDVNGFDLQVTLRTLPGLGDVPAFMCSADSQPADLQRADSAGFCGYWPKPIAVAGVLADLDALSEDRPRV